MRLKLWIKAIRAPFFTATIIPVSWGTLLGRYASAQLAGFRFFLALSGALCLHAGTNLANDYFDHLSGCDSANPNPTPFSGGSRVIQDGLISPRQVLFASLIFFALGGVIGFYLNYICAGNVIIFLGLAGILLGFFYSAKPLALGYAGLGELAVGIGFGPLMVLGAYYTQAGHFSFKAFLGSLPVAMLITAVLLINEFPDYVADKLRGKKSLVVVLGKRKALRLYQVLLITPYVLLAGLVFLKFLPFICLLAFLTLPWALKASRIAERNFAKIYELLPANGLTIGVHLAFGLLLCAGIILSGCNPPALP